MVKFSITNSDLIAFLEKCTCKGVVLITASEKTTKNFFNYFYMDIVKGDEEQEESGYILVKAIDSEERRMYIKHRLANVEVETAGRLAITDADILLSVLKSITPSREINFELKSDETVLKIETKEGKPYFGANIRQITLHEDLQVTLDDNNTTLTAWDTVHTFDEEADRPRFTVPEGTALYNTRVIISKQELVKPYKHSITLTKDQDLKFSMVKEEDDWLLKIDSGKKADDITMEAEFDKNVDDPITFENMIITNLHPIVNHLFSTSTFYFRIAGEDGALKYWIRSREGNIELNFNSSSI